MLEDDSDFNLSGDTKDEIVLIAGGKIGPLKDLIIGTLKSGTSTDIRLFLGVNTQKDLKDYERLRDLAELTDNFSVITALNTPNPEWDGEVGLVTEVVRDKLNPDRVKKSFVYGTEVMIEETKRTLSDLGLPEEKIEEKSFNRDSYGNPQDNEVQKLEEELPV